MNNIQLNEIQNIFDIEISSLELAKQKAGSNYFYASELIANANKIVISGIGKSGLIARKIAATLSSYNISAVFLHPVEALHGDIGIIQENDVILLLSKSGSTEELVRLVPFIKSRNAKIISIVSNINSYLAHNSDIVLEAAIDKEACPFNLAPTSSTTVSLVIGDALAVTAAKLREITLENFSKTHPLGTIGKQVTLQVKDVMHTYADLPVIPKDSSFKAAIIASSSKGLGCVVIVDENQKLCGLITDGDVRRTLQKYDEFKDLKVTDVMTEKPVSISPDVYLDVALAIMENRQSQINVIPVIDSEQKLCGILRLHDIIRSGI